MSDKKLPDYLQDTINRLQDEHYFSDEAIAMFAISGRLSDLVDVAGKIYETLDSMDQRLRWIEGHLDTMSRRDFV